MFYNKGKPIMSALLVMTNTVVGQYHSSKENQIYQIDIWNW